MNTQELRAAIISYPAGTKFSHPYFGKDEYIVTDDNLIPHTEDGYECNDEFFEIRKDWDGWYVVGNDDNRIGYDPNNDLMNTYYLTDHYYNEHTNHIGHCDKCRLLKADNTCPYSRKPIKHPEITYCKYFILNN